MTDPRVISPEIPRVMKAVELTAYGSWESGLRVVEKEVPAPGPGEVLVRMTAAPINPVDLAFIHGIYGVKKELPVVPGFEGTGVVVAAGKGMLGRFLHGKRVACGAPDRGDGTWAEYMVTGARRCVPLSGKTGVEQGATMLINPMTASILVRQVREGKHRAFMQTAAAGAVGRMIASLAERFGIPGIHLVHRAEQVEFLQSRGVATVLCTRDPDFGEKLGAACRDLQPTIAFDAVAGDMTERLLRALPRGGKVVVYGSLSLKNCRITPGRFIFEKKFLEGFWLVDWIRDTPFRHQLRLALGLQKFLNSELKTEIRKHVPLAHARDGIAEYVQNMTAGKILLVNDT